MNTTETPAPPDPRTRATTRRAIPRGPAAVAIGAAAYVGALHVVDPFQSHTVGCPFLGITGWWCPGCGSSRAVHLVSEGDVLGSFAYHPFVVPLLVLLGWWWAGWFVTTRRGHQPRWARSPTQLSSRFVVMIAIAFVSLWILRNIDPFSFLAPPS